jgi:predicted dehydrogenase
MGDNDNRRYRLAIVAPGHFHAALALRQMHPRLDDTVHVYAPEGTELTTFLALVESFNARAEAPTRWRLATYRGPDYLQRALAERAADLAVLAGRNDGKLALIEQLHGAGLHVLADKPMLVDGGELDRLKAVLARPPLIMELMTSRHEPANRVLNAIVRSADAFGQFVADGSEPAIRLRGTHHLHKLVNGAALVRPAWYFDVNVQGEGMLDVTTHMVDQVQALTDGGALELVEARQWPTMVPRRLFAEITGCDDFPPELAPVLRGSELALLCNAGLYFRGGGVPVQIESLWALTQPPGGGDTHYATLCGSRATVTLEDGPETGGEFRITVRPAADDPSYAETLQEPLVGLARVVPVDGGYRVEIADDLKSGHEEHFAMVLDRFLAALDAGRLRDGEARNCLSKYALLAQAKAAAHAAER